MPLRPDRWPAGAAAAGGPAVLLRQPRVHRTQFAEQPAALTMPRARRPSLLRRMLSTIAVALAGPR